MKYLIKFMIIGLFFSLLGCELFIAPIKETPTGYEIQKGTDMSVILQDLLSSNVNLRGDSFTTLLKEPLIFNNKTILPKDTQIRGLVKRVTKFEKLGDQASLLLLFDQIVLSDRGRFPIDASLDTKKGEDILKIKGKVIKDATIIGGSALVGTLAGKKTFGKDGEKKGLIIGTVAGAGAVILSNMKEIRLPVGTELIVKLDKPLLIPK